MFEQEDASLERVIQQLRHPVAIDPALDARVMRAIAAAPARPGTWPWGRLAALGVAAAILLLLLARPWRRSEAASASAWQFVFVAPQAASVSIVGDFNDWDPKRSPMSSVTHRGVWATVLPLAPGRYRYAFLVNGVEWRADPAAPAARDDEFGTPSSVITVAGKGS